MKKYASLALWIFAFEAVSMAIGTATQGSVDGWYASLTAPPLTPPNIAFPIMWTILYALIASAGWFIWRARNDNDGRNKVLLALFVVYMAINWSWTYIFFAQHWMGLGFLWIMALNAVSLTLILTSWNRVRQAALLLIPPFIWTGFAAYLNAGYWLLNS